MLLIRYPVSWSKILLISKLSVLVVKCKIYMGINWGKVMVSYTGQRKDGAKALSIISRIKWRSQWAEFEQEWEWCGIGQKARHDLTRHQISLVKSKTNADGGRLVWKTLQGVRMAMLVVETRELAMVLSGSVVLTSVFNLKT